MTLDEILQRLEAEGFEGCYIQGYDVVIANRGEIELAHGEAKIFDRKYPWPDYGNHPLHKDIDSLFADVNATWSKETPAEEPDISPIEVEDEPPEEAEEEPETAEVRETAEEEPER